MSYLKRHLISLGLTLLGLGSVAIAEPVFTMAQNSSIFNQPISSNTGQRRLQIELAISTPDDLKVDEGDLVGKGDVIADRAKERSRYEFEQQQTELAIARIEASELLPPPEPLPVAPIKPLPEANFDEEEARISTAEMKYRQAQRNYNSALSIDPYISAQADVNLYKSKVDQANRKVELSQRKVDAIAALKNLPPEVVTHEVEKLKLVQSEAEQALAEYQFKQSEFQNVKQRRVLQLEELAEKVDGARSDLELSQAQLREARSQREFQEYQHSIEVARRAEEANQAAIAYARQKQEYAQQLRDREFQLAQLRAKLSDINEKLTELAVVRSPYNGKITRIKTEKQTDNTLRVTVSLDPLSTSTSEPSPDNPFIPRPE